MAVWYPTDATATTWPASGAPHAWDAAVDGERGTR